MNTTTLAFGQKLGMFPGISYGAPMATGFSSEEDKLLTPEQRSQDILDRRKDERYAAFLAPFLKQPTLEELEAAEERRARRAQEIGKESLKEGFKYSMLANIPKSISQAYAGLAATNLYGGQAIADTAARTLGAYPSPQFASVNFQPQKYFG